MEKMYEKLMQFTQVLQSIQKKKESVDTVKRNVISEKNE